MLANFRDSRGGVPAGEGVKEKVGRGRKSWGVRSAEEGQRNLLAQVSSKEAILREYRMFHFWFTDMACYPKELCIIPSGARYKEALRDFMITV